MGTMRRKVVDPLMRKIRNAVQTTGAWTADMVVDVSPLIEAAVVGTARAVDVAVVGTTHAVDAAAVGTTHAVDAVVHVVGRVFRTGESVGTDRPNKRRRQRRATPERRSSKT